MKKNAILIAGIMVVSGLSTQAGPAQSNYSTDTAGDTVRNTENIDRTGDGTPVSPSHIATSSQYDPASAGSFQADSSIRGGSNEARGRRGYGRTDFDSSSHPMNPAHQADSSIRGGSAQARDRSPSSSSEVSTGDSQQSLKADSSIRGGSNEARGWRDYHNHDSATAADSQTGLNLYQGNDSDLVPQGDLSSRRSGGLDYGTAANWNASDDLMQDGTETQQPDGFVVIEFGDNDNGIAQEQRSSDNATSLNSTRDGLNAPSEASGGFAASQSGTGSSNDNSSPNGASAHVTGANLNSSSHLEQDISGEYNLDDQLDSSHPSQPNAGSNLSSSSADHAIGVNNSDPAIPQDDSFNSHRSSDIVHNDRDIPAGSSTDAALNSKVTSDQDEAVGGPGSTEVGSSSSAEAHSSNSLGSSVPESQVGITSDWENWQFKNNRAQGVGSAATGEFGVANSNGSGLSAASGMNDTQLAQKVKSTIVKESTGITDATRTEAKGIQVSANNGQVTLRGTVASERDKKAMELQASQISGVKRVDNQLKVSNPHSASDKAGDFSSGRNLEDSTDQLQH